MKWKISLILGKETNRDRVSSEERTHARLGLINTRTEVQPDALL